MPLAPATVGLLPQLELVLPAVPAPWAFVAPVAVVPDVPEPDAAAPVVPVDVPEPEVPVDPEPPDPEPPPAPWANADVAKPSARALTVSNFSTLCFLSICLALCHAATPTACYDKGSRGTFGNLCCEHAPISETFDRRRCWVYGIAGPVNPP